MPPQLDTTSWLQQALASIRATAMLEDSSGCLKPSNMSIAASNPPPMSQVRRRTKKSVIGLHRKYRLVGSESRPIKCDCVPLPTPWTLRR